MNNLIIAKTNPYSFLTTMFIFLCLSVSTNLKAQSKVTGVVLDEKGAPMFGVSVVIKSTKKVELSDVNGKFSIQLQNSQDVLTFSFVGFESFETKVTKSSNLKIILKSREEKIDEVIVIGYGTSTKKDLTGAVAKAPIADMLKAPVSNFTDALSGRVSGVIVSSSDGQPGAPPKITIRGNNSVTQDNSPLYVIDGFPIEGPNLGSINPQDIESIEVLKDASATAIYGARGANGVIMITTKKGKVGPPSINFSTSTGYQEITKKMDLMSPFDYLSYQREKDSVSNNFYISSGVTSPGYYTDSLFYRFFPKDKYKSVDAANMQDLMYVKAPLQNYNLTISGGDGKTNYLISGNILNQDGILVNSGYKRYQGRVNLDQVISRKIKVGINANYTYNKQWGGATQPGNISGYFASTFAPNYSIYGYRPVTPLSSNGTQAINVEEDFIDPGLYQNTGVAVSMVVNPYLNQIHQVKEDYINNLATNTFIDYQILPSLKLRITGGITTNVQRNQQFYDTLTSQGSKLTSYGAANGVNGSVINYYSNYWANENVLNYKKVFKKSHSIDALVGFSESGVKVFSNGAAANQLPNPKLGINGLDEGTPLRVVATESNSTLASILGRLNYAYKYRYYFTASYRADGSSRFSPKNKWAYFPSGSFKWRFSEEKIMKQNKFLTDGSLRLSYGETGNNRVSDFPYLTSITSQQNMFVFNNSQVSGAYPSTLANNNLKWETTEQTNIGIDLGFFENKRITVTADVYKKVTKDLLLNSTIPTSLGFSTVFNNIGSISNQGLELSITSVNMKSKFFSWITNFNISWNQNKVLSLAANQESLVLSTGWEANYVSSPGYIAKIGQPLGLLYGLVWDGVYSLDDFDYSAALNTSAGSAGKGSHYILKNSVPTNGNSRAVIQPGDIKYKDLNGDGIVNSSDFTIIGNGLPIHTGGINNNFIYKNFDLNIFFQWSYGADIQNANRIIFDGNANNVNAINQFASYNDRWSPANTLSKNFRVGGAGPVGFYSSRTVEDGSYIRLKTIQFGYNINAAALRKAYVKSARLYMSAQNLLTWTKYSGQDPEIGTYNSVLTPNFDWSGYPRARTITIGANFTF